MIIDGDPAVLSAAVVPAAKPTLDSFPITDLIAWRDTASHDVTAWTEQRDFFALSLKRLDKKRLDKVRWIRRLNTVIARKAFPGRVK